MEQQLRELLDLLVLPASTELILMSVSSFVARFQIDCTKKCELRNDDDK